MGVHGLWRLIEPSGKPVPLETLENKVLAVDISIWLHQSVKGFQDSKGAPVPNAHLLGIYHRVCKLLYFRIKPIFVFDGGVPALKRQTIAKRTQSKLKNIAQADKIQKQLLSTLLKHTAVSKILTEKIEASLGTVTKVPPKQRKDDIYALPPSEELDSTLSSSEDELESETTTTDSSPTKNWDLYSIDMDSAHFKSLPTDVRHEILTDLKETRKQSSWGRLYELPKVSDDFSVYQLNRLRKRQAIQTALEEAEKEMGGKSLSLAELESILKDQGIITNQNVGNRIASDENKKYLLVKDVKKAMEEAIQNELESNNKALEDTPLVTETDEKSKTKADIEYEDDLQKAIALSLECEPATSEPATHSDGPSTSDQRPRKTKTTPADFSFLENFTDADFASSSGDEEPPETKVTRSKMSSAESYMLEYSGLTPSEIAKIISKKTADLESGKHKSKKSVLTLISENKDENPKSKQEMDVKHGKMDDRDRVKERGKEPKDDNFIEILSTDSSKSENDKKRDPKKGIDIVINARQQPEDDLFGDIFQDSRILIKEHNKQVNDNDDNTVEITSTDSESFSDEEPLETKVTRSKMYSSKKAVLPLISENKDEISKSKQDMDVNHGKTDNRDAVKERDKEPKDDNSIMSTDSSESENRKNPDTKKGMDIVINPSQQPEDDLFGDIFQDTKIMTKEYNKQFIDNTVEIMSTDSSDSESDEKTGTKKETVGNNLDLQESMQEVVSRKTINIPENRFEQDAGTVAGDNTSDTIRIDSSEVSKLNENEVKGALEIVVNPDEHINQDDDLFSDIFGKEKTETECSVEGVSDMANKVISQGNEYDKNDNTDSRCLEDQHNKQTYQKLDGLIDAEKDNISQTDKESVSIKNVTSNKNLDREEFKTNSESITEQELLKLKTELQKEKVDLLNEKSSKERIAGNITDQMYQEAQELLELFGMPYIIAPMEAEAQCAFLDEIELTDGTITDDSDIWLFGGKTVYKNFFNQSKYVMEFRAESIQHHFKLTREQMVLLALLVGSDYTTGLQGVGPVTAVEILAAFPPSKGKINEFSLSHAALLSGLKEFRSWFSKGKSSGAGRNTLKSKLKNLTFTDNFPSLQVVEAYLEPTVETSRESFSWGKPNTLALIEFAREKFGWTRNKSEEILNPVIKRLEEGRHQKSIKDYFKTRFKVYSGEAESKMSKRVKSAITNMGRDPSEIIAEELEEELRKEPRQRAPRKKRDAVEAPEFSKKKRVLATTKKDTLENVSGQDKGSESDKDFSESAKGKNRRKTGKANLEKLKPKSKNEDNQLPSTSQITETINTEGSHRDEDVDISEKINHIRKRRQLNEAKAAIDIKKPKVQKEKPKKANLEKLKPNSQNEDNQLPSTSQITESINTVTEGNNRDEEVDISEKINHIRKRRQLKEAKAAIDIKMLKVQKEQLKKVAKQFEETIPEGLQADEEVNLLSQIAIESSLKVDEINKTLQDQIKMLTNKAVQISKPSPTPPSASQPSPSVKRPIFRPTRVPRKEPIPQKEKNKSMLLRNKLKAIEVFRKGKHGPGYVPKREKRKKLPKNDADLSESSDE